MWDGFPRGTVDDRDCARRVLKIVMGEEDGQCSRIAVWNYKITSSSLYSPQTQCSRCLWVTTNPSGLVQVHSDGRAFTYEANCVSDSVSK